MQHAKLDKFNRSTFDEWTPLQRMRLSELRRICSAYEIPFLETDKQRDLLPIVQRAMDSGIFTPGPTFISGAKKPWFLTGENAPTVTPLEVVPVSLEDASVEHMGMKRKHCVVVGDNIIKDGFQSKEKAQEWLTHSYKP